MTESRARSEFDEAVARPDDALDLAYVSLLIAREEYPDLDVGAYVARLDALGAEARRRVAPAAGTEEAVSALNALLFREEGFRGNSDDYYDPRNSFLNEVLDRRTGIPLTLSAVYIEVARRAGVEVHGVGLPGHFVVRAPGPGHGVLLDPFHGGARLSLEDCRKRLERIYARRVPIEPRMLEACGPRAMVLRMLRNLKAIYARREDHLRLLRVHDLLLRLTPGDPEELRERGLLHASIDCYDLAARDLEASLGHGRDAPEAALVRAQIEDLRRRAARLN